MHEFEAIGTKWWLERLDGGAFDDEIRQTLADYTEQFDRRYSRFRSDSLVTQLAQTGQLDHPPKEMLDMLEYAKKMYKATDGLMDLLVGTRLTTLGYGKRFVVPPEEQASFLHDVRWNKTTVTVPCGVELDFGGFGKGWLIDQYARILRSHDVHAFIVNGGGDLFCQSPEPVSFALANPFDDGLQVGEASIATGALAASSIVKRAWEINGEKQHHIIDPRTGKPSTTKAVASFVMADTALVADTLATVLIIEPAMEQRLREAFDVQTVILYTDQ